MFLEGKAKEAVGQLGVNGPNSTPVDAALYISFDPQQNPDTVIVIILQ